MKIDEIEEIFINGGYTDNLFNEYIEKLEKRVKDNFNKSERIRITSLKMKDYNNAIKLLKYSIDNYVEDFFETFYAYYYLGEIYYKSNDYKNAKENLLIALKLSKKDETKKNYGIQAYEQLIKVELESNNYKYTDNLEEYVNKAYEKKPFLFLKEIEYYKILGKMVVSEHYKDKISFKEYKNKALYILNNDITNDIMKKHKISNELYATKKSLNYLNKKSKLYNLTRILRYSLHLFR